MSNAIFPTLAGLSWGVKKTPIWSTNVQTSANGREVRATYFSYPRWKFSLSFEVLRTKRAVNELEQLAGFFNARRGSFESFLYEDPTDNEVTNQTIAIVEEGKTKYQLLRSYGGFVEPVLAVKGSPSIRVGGVLKTRGRDYSITNMGVLVFVTPQPVGQPITWTGNFYFRVRFVNDTTDFENFIGHLWSAKKIELMSVKL